MDSNRAIVVTSAEKALQLRYQYSRKFTKLAGRASARLTTALELIVALQLQELVVEYARKCK
jgi:hypothetical protein